MEDLKYEEEDPLALSRIDVISCGLGGAVLLALVFMLVRHTTPVEVSAPPFITVHWEIVGNTGDYTPIITPIVKPPEAPYAFDIHLADFDLEGNQQPKPPGERERSNEYYEPDWGTYTLYGFSRFRPDIDLESEVNPFEATIPNPVYRLNIASPKSGNWRFGVRFESIAEGRSRHADLNLGETKIIVKFSIITREQKRIMESEPIALRVGDGAISDLVVNIPAW